MSLQAEVLSIGDELIHGALLDTNAQYIAQQLEPLGVALQRFTVTSDDPAAMRVAVLEACQRADVVIATGGLGPTLDDRTREVVADLLDEPLVFDEQSWAQVTAWLQQRGRPVPDSNRRQAFRPRSAAAIPNPIGTAPGFAVRLQRARLFALPGVPVEMRAMLANSVLPELVALPGLMPVAQRWLRILGPSEAALGERIAGFMVPGRMPAVGITASGGLLTIRVVGRAASAEAAAALCDATVAELRPLVASWVFAEGEVELPQAVVQHLASQRRTLAVAESCTGGLLANRLVDVAGASAVFAGGVVAYANASKSALLGVPAALLDRHGAVSEPVAAAMAAGARRRLGCDLAVSTTGIAGPTGGTPAKPVGTVCFGFADQDSVRAWTVAIPDLGRNFVRERAVVEVWRALLCGVPSTATTVPEHGANP
jgi:nicotinamide-nucleotide amidase